MAGKRSTLEQIIAKLRQLSRLQRRCRSLDICKVQDVVIHDAFGCQLKLSNLGLSQFLSQNRNSVAVALLKLNPRRLMSDDSKPIPDEIPLTLKVGQHRNISVTVPRGPLSDIGLLLDENVAEQRSYEAKLKAQAAKKATRQK